MKKNIEIKSYYKGDKRKYKKIYEIAVSFSYFLDREDIYDQILKKNIKGAHSDQIKNILLIKARELGFKSEKQGLFRNYSINYRPDYFRPLGKGGIILEVERGRTVNNNNDLLDFWKCHICKEANHLILIVPKHVSHTRNIYKKVKERLAFFFEKKNYTNVESVHIIGY